MLFCSLFSPSSKFRGFFSGNVGDSLTPPPPPLPPPSSAKGLSDHPPPLVLSMDPCPGPPFLPREASPPTLGILQPAFFSSTRGGAWKEVWLEDTLLGVFYAQKKLPLTNSIFFSRPQVLATYLTPPCCRPANPNHNRLILPTPPQQGASSVHLPLLRIQLRDMRISPTAPKWFERTSNALLKRAGMSGRINTRSVQGFLRFQSNRKTQYSRHSQRMLTPWE